jgi:hypothetical protein
LAPQGVICIFTHKTIKIKVMLYAIPSPEHLKKQISKLQPLNYNQFRWWRRFDTKFKPLPKGTSFYQRIRNGEFEFSHYFWQAQHCEQEINQKYSACGGDMQKMLENHAVDFARRKRLWEDFNTHETNMLQEICKNFTIEFNITDRQYQQEAETFDGTLEELYIHIQKTYSPRTTKVERRGRPKKQSI